MRLRIAYCPAAMHILIITAVEQEAAAIGPVEFAHMVVGGVGRVNAACATTEAIIHHGPFHAVINAGVAGALPRIDDGHCENGRNGNPVDRFAVEIGEVLAAVESIYAEEGLSTPEGFCDMESLGFPLGDFRGNVVPADANLLRIASSCGMRIERVATVATCSGRDDAALEIARRTRAAAEAMEGAAVLHAAKRLGLPAIELRAIANTTGDRSQQQWNLKAALSALGQGVQQYLQQLRDIGLSVKS